MLEIEKHCCLFAEWLQENRWFYYEEKTKMWHYTFEQGTTISTEQVNKHYRKTTIQLFQRYLSEIIKSK